MNEFIHGQLEAIGQVTRAMLGDMNPEHGECGWVEALRWGLAVLGAACAVKILIGTFW